MVTKMKALDLATCVMHRLKSIVPLSKIYIVILFLTVMFSNRCTKIVDTIESFLRLIRISKFIYVKTSIT